VAQTFIGKAPNNQEVNHKDGKKGHAHLDNLEYVTRSGNLEHAWATGLRKPLPAGKKFTQEQRAGISKDRFELDMSYRKIAAKYGVYWTSIRTLCDWITKHGDIGNV